MTVGVQVRSHRFATSPASSGSACSIAAMARKVWTAAELEKMTPAERHALVEASIIWDLSEIPEEFLERVPAGLRERIAASEQHKG